MRRQILIAPVVLALALSGCANKVAVTPGKASDPKLDQLALANARVHEGVRLAITTKRALLADGKITPATSAQWTKVLKRITQANNEINDRAAEFDSFTAGRADLFKLFQQLKLAYTDLHSQGTIPGSSGFDRALELISIGVGATEKIFQ